MILKTVITTLDTLAFIIFVGIGLIGLRKENDTEIVSLIFALLIEINAVMMWN